MRDLIFTLAVGCALWMCAEKPFWGAQEAYLERQTAEQLTVVDSLLRVYTPSDTLHGLERGAALAILDGILHDVRLDGSPAVKAFMRQRVGRVADSLKAPMAEGLHIYKLYNDGFVARTPLQTVAIDIVRGPGGLISDSLMAEVLNHCDMLLLTHNHSDHIDTAIIEMMLGQGKPVYGPPGPILDNIRGVTLVYPDTLSQIATGIEVLPAYQDHLLNNIYIITTPEGYIYAHTGDLWCPGDVETVEGVAHQLPSVDVLMINCWARDLGRLIPCFKPRMTLTGHENELGHTIDHREAYWLSQQKLSRLPYPSAVLAWGENIQYYGPKK